MESEISLLMTNQTLVSAVVQSIRRRLQGIEAAPGKLIYDPFMGTGSMAYVAAIIPHTSSIPKTCNSQQHILAHSYLDPTLTVVR